MPDTFTVKLEVRERSGYLSAVCAELPGLHVCGDTAESVGQSAMRAIKTLYRVNFDREVTVSQTGEWSEFQVTTI